MTYQTRQWSGECFSNTSCIKSETSISKYWCIGIDIGVCGIIPRKGNSNHIHTVNEKATNVNKYLEKLCLKDEVLTYIDVEHIFAKNGNAVRLLYEKQILVEFISQFHIWSSICSSELPFARQTQGN